MIANVFQTNASVATKHEAHIAAIMQAEASRTGHVAKLPTDMESRSGKKLKECRKKDVLAAMDTRKWLMVKDIAARAGVSEETVRRAVPSLVSRGEALGRADPCRPRMRQFRRVRSG